MPYGTANVDTIQSSTAGTPVQFNDGNGTQVGTLCRAWVNFNGASGASPVIRASFNVSSVTRNGTGDYTITFTNALPDSKYAASLGAGSTTVGSSNFNYGFADYSYPRTTTTLRVYYFTSSGVAFGDTSNYDVSVFR